VSSIDLLVLILILVSAFVSFVRGAVKEVVSLATWILAIVIAVTFSSRFATILPRDTIESPAARAGISAAILFLGCLAVGTLVGYLVRKMTERGPLGIVDRFAGAFFGSVRGVVIVVLLVLAANLVPSVKQETWWRSSWLLPRFQIVARELHARLPPDIAQHFDFSTSTS